MFTLSSFNKLVIIVISDVNKLDDHFCIGSCCKDTSRQLNYFLARKLICMNSISEFQRIPSNRKKHIMYSCIIQIIEYIPFTVPLILVSEFEVRNKARQSNKKCKPLQKDRIDCVIIKQARQVATETQHVQTAVV